jgi:chromosome segregation ATPase
MTEVNLREASRAAVHLTKQLKAVLVVGEALEQIENLDNMRDEAVRLQGEESAKLLEIKEKIAEAEEELAAVDFDKEQSLEAKRDADSVVRSKLEQADYDAGQIRNAAERVANEKAAQAETAFVAKADEYDAALSEASIKLDKVNDEVAEAEAKLKTVLDRYVRFRRRVDTRVPA